MAAIVGRPDAEHGLDVVRHPGDAQPRRLPQPIARRDQEVREPLVRERRGSRVLEPQQLRADQPGDPLECRSVPRREAARPAVDHAQRADRAPLHLQRHAGIEADEGLAPDEGVVREARIGQRVLDQEQAVLGDRMGTERFVARRLAGRHADAGLEPLAGMVDQADQGDRGVEHLRRQPRQVVERRIRGRVQNAEPVQHCEAFGFVGRDRREHGESAVGDDPGLGGVRTLARPSCPGNVEPEGNVDNRPISAGFPRAHCRCPDGVHRPGAPTRCTGPGVAAGDQPGSAQWSTNRASAGEGSSLRHASPTSIVAVRPAGSR